MVTRDPRVDAYIEKAPDFARSLLVELRARVHAVCPEVVETVKWRMPSFEFHGLLAGMAAFKAHCTFGFWKDKVLRRDGGDAAVLDRLGCMKAASDLPGKAAFGKQVKAAMRLNVDKVVAPRPKRTKRPELPVPADLARALAASPKAQAAFDGFAPSHRREYVEWITGAKKDETRQRRIDQAIEWLAAGKHRNWKYENC